MNEPVVVKLLVLLVLEFGVTLNELKGECQFL